MAKKDKRERDQKKRAVEPPVLTILSDQALKPEETYRDSFALNFHLGPVYDILRHPDTRTPMGILIHGPWGAGKTTAMKWLHGMVEIWNSEGKGDSKVRVKPVWFYPWKYHKKEDVWRGLISEVVLKSISVEDATVKTVTSAAKRFGVFLGRSFVHVLAGIKLKAKAGTDAAAAEGELSLSVIKDILEEYREASHPEKAYLNEFEDTLSSWLDETLGDNERMVIFIDDLDRCMPEVALEVLEALKLYLNIGKLIFVVGVDRAVIDKLVKEHYRKLGLDEAKSGKYLDKMFQVEVPLAPNEQQIRDFLLEQLKGIAYWTKHLSEEERGIFQGLIFELAERNPREVKRLINSALMFGAGALTADVADAGVAVEFRQGLQLFFVLKILTDRYDRGSYAGTDDGIAFFQAWSGIVSSDADAPRTVQLSEKDLELLESTSIRGEGAGERGEMPQVAKLSDRTPDLTQYPETYHHVLLDPRFRRFLKLLADTDLGDLMRVPYSVEAGALVTPTAIPDPKGIIRKRIAIAFAKDPQGLTQEDFLAITGLDLSDAEIADVAPLSNLQNLQRLDLSFTEASDIAPLSNLHNLQSLYLRGTQVSNIAPLSNLHNLQRLSLASTQVSDIAPLSNLHNLRTLSLRSTQVSDIVPLSNLENLDWLSLRSTQVSEEQVAQVKQALPKLRIDR